MGFRDRLEDDVRRVFLGGKTFEEDLTYIDSSGTETPMMGVVDVDSFNTGAGFEVEFNPGISSMAQFYVASINFPTIPKENEEIRQEEEGKIWRIQQIKKESGLYTLVCSCEHKIKRGRIR